MDSQKGMALGRLPDGSSIGAKAATEAAAAFAATFGTATFVVERGRDRASQYTNRSAISPASLIALRHQPGERPAERTDVVDAFIDVADLGDGQMAQFENGVRPSIRAQTDQLLDLREWCAPEGHVW